MVEINLLRDKCTSTVFIIGSAVISARLGSYDAIMCKLTAVNHTQMEPDR